MKIVERILDGKFSELKEDIEQKIAERTADRIKAKKDEVLSKLNENKQR